MVPPKSKYDINISDVIREIKDAYYIPFVSQERLITRINRITYENKHKDRCKDNVQGVRKPSRSQQIPDVL